MSHRKRLSNPPVLRLPVRLLNTDKIFFISLMVVEMMPYMHIGQRKIGQGQPVYIIAELSANHNQNFDLAVKTIQAARDAGADAIKLQTYTPDTLTIDCDNEYFRIQGTLWEGRTLYDLYAEAFTPWEWHAELQRIAEKCGLDFFSTPFDPSAVDFLENLAVPAYKVASFEIVDLPLLQKIAATGKPVIMSCGMATLAEIEEAVTTLRQAGTKELALLKCTSAYPAPVEEINLRTIPHLGSEFQAVAGLSDHSQGVSVPVAAVALGASVIEKHLVVNRSVGGPDSSFSLDAAEFKAMVDSVRQAEKALGVISYEVTAKEAQSRVFRRSLFVVEKIRAGEVFSEKNVRSIRPGHGLHPRHYREILGRKAARGIDKGTPLNWTHIAQE